MATLNRAFPFEEMRQVAVCVTEQLHLDVARTLHVALAEDTVLSERGFRLPFRRRESVLQLRGLADNSHAAPAAACRGLDDDGVADLLGLAGRNDRDAGLGRDPLRLELVAIRPHCIQR